MNDFEHIRAVKKAVQSRLLSIPGIHAIGIGAKYTGGQNTSEPAIIVFVIKKKLLSDVLPQEVVPPEIDGIKTDIIEVPEPEIYVDLDGSSYRPLDGGIQIRAGLDINGYGTLGCIALTKEPEPKVVAITCQHVVTMWSGGKQTNLIATVSPNQHTLTFSGSNTPGSLIVLRISIMPTGPGPSQDLEMFWATDNTDTLVTLASKVASGINGLANPGVSATANGAQVAITWGPNFIVLVPNCFVYDSSSADPQADLRASIAGNVIILSGRVSGEYYGVYTNVHLGGDKPSYGVFTSHSQGDALSTITASIANAVNAHIPGASASASGPQITITGAQYIQCVITSDARVGWPDNTFCSQCCSWYDQRIGRVIDARLDIDTALIQLDPGLKYKAEIEEIGVVSGTYEVTVSDAISGAYLVKKRGRTTLLTSGTVHAVQVDGDISLTDSNGPPPKKLFHRHYTDAISIDSNTLDPFAQPGDSGSAVTNASNEVVGIVFGGGGLTGLVTHIDPITTALNIRIATATSSGIIQTVPTPAAVPAVSVPSPVSANATTIINLENNRSAISPFTYVAARQHEIEQEITATQAGRRYAALVRCHFSEVNRLVNKNRRVATVWHRNGGPQLIQRLIQMFQRSNETLLVEINGKPLIECLARIQKILIRYGSPSLSSDLLTYGPGLGRLAGLTYPQILLTLQTWEGE